AAHYTRDLRTRTPRSTLFPYTTLFRSSLRSALRPCSRKRRTDSCEGQPKHEPPINSSAALLDCWFHFFCGTGPSLQVVYRSIKRSEEHTSELQSRGQLVCRLLLEKKK